MPPVKPPATREQKREDKEIYERRLHMVYREAMKLVRSSNDWSVGQCADAVETAFCVLQDVERYFARSEANDRNSDICNLCMGGREYA